MKFYDIMKDILSKKSKGKLCDDPDFKKEFSSYMLVRYLSMRDELMPYAELLNGYQKTLSQEQMYKLAFSIVPKQNNQFISYLKKTAQPKKTKSKKNELDESED